jgi:hypothetical protein
MVKEMAQVSPGGGSRESVLDATRRMIARAKALILRGTMAKTNSLRWLAGASSVQA